MPRPVRPARLGPPDIQQFIKPLDTSSRSDIADKLGVAELSENAAGTLQELIAKYRASLEIAPTTGQVMTAIRELQGAKGKLLGALADFTDENSWIDIETFGSLNPVVKKCMAALEHLDSVANAQLARLGSSRVSPATECLRQFCGTLRLFFQQFANAARTKSPRSTNHLREFALAVFDACDIDHADYDTHPERLDEMLRTDALAAAPPFSIEGTVKGSLGGVRF
jgi:hypothetical protein